jgi:hypothetical protein
MYDSNLFCQAAPTHLPQASSFAQIKQKSTDDVLNILLCQFLNFLKARDLLLPKRRICTITNYHV